MRVTKHLELAKQMLRVIPKTMVSIRGEFRVMAQAEFTTLQFRILAHLSNGKSASNSELAEYMGTSVPGMSRLVDYLVRRHYLVRVRSKRDRRQVIVRLSPSGSKKYGALRQATENRFSEYFASVNLSEARILAEGLDLLEKLIDTGRDSVSNVPNIPKTLAKPVLAKPMKQTKRVPRTIKKDFTKEPKNSEIPHGLESLGMREPKEYQKEFPKTFSKIFTESGGQSE